jgi:hypothetical protein
MVDILEVPAEVAALSEGLVAETALERSLTSMFSKVVAQVAGLLEHAPTPIDFALEVELYSLRLWVAFLDGLMPGTRDSVEGL